MLLLQAIASSQWVVQSFDITTAFLRGKSGERELAMEAPAEFKALLRMGHSKVCLLQGNAYGRVDATLLFYKEFRRRLESVGCPSPGQWSFSSSKPQEARLYFRHPCR